MSAENKKKRKQPEITPVIPRKYLALSFSIPFLIMGTAFALNNLFPFGDRLITHDFQYQYYPFFSDLWHKIRDGSISTWSWTSGLGHDYIALFAYYMASPLNLLVMLTPYSWLREAMMFVLLIKVGCAGLFTDIFLRYTFKQTGFNIRLGGLSLAIFSSLYALCAFTHGFFWNIMWFDSFALLPLVMTGLFALMREGKRLLYIAALSLAVFSNFYMSFFVCLSVAMVFLSFCFINKFDFKLFLSKLSSIAGYSVLALGMTAVFLIPVYSMLQSTYAIGKMFPDKLFFYIMTVFDLLGNFIAFTPPAIIDGLPNFYTGMISLMLLGFFAVCTKISLREKLIFFGVIIFLILCCNHNALDYIMHGFHFVNGMPHRFTFLISLLLTVMAYRSFSFMDGMTAREWKTVFAAMLFCITVFLLSAVFGLQEKNAIIGSAVLCAVYLVLFYIFFNVKMIKTRTVIKSAFLLVIVTELFLTSYIGVKTSDNYYEKADAAYSNEQIQKILNIRSQTDNDFYRTEMIPSGNSNGAFLYNYKGVSFFSSTMNDNITRFMRGLGMPGGGTANNFISYRETTPLLDSFTNMRYIIAQRGLPADRGRYWESIERIENSILAEYRYFLPLGFMVNEEIISYNAHPRNPFLSQNNLFRLATSLESDLFDVIELSAGMPMSIDGNNGTVTWNYEMPFEVLYAFFNTGENKKSISISRNGSFLRNINIIDNIPCITTVARFNKGDIVSFTSDRDSIIYAGSINSDIFDQGFALLADEVLNLSEISGSKVRGEITVLKDGILYTSIPGKNWNVYVDGVKSELLLIGNAMAGVRLTKGTHEVEFRYLNKSFVAGVIVSIVSVSIFVTLIIFDVRKRRSTT